MSDPEYDKYEAAYDIALDLLEAEGQDPEFLSMVEAADEVAVDFGLSDDEQDALLEEVKRLIAGAEVKYKLPGRDE